MSREAKIHNPVPQLGHNLKVARLRAGYESKMDVVRKTGIPHTALFEIEENGRRVRVDELLLLAQLYNVRIDTLLSESECKPNLTKYRFGDKVINVNPRSVYYNQIGTFIRYWSDKLTFANGRGCDVLYNDATDLYGRRNIAQSVSDLELVVGVAEKC